MKPQALLYLWEMRTLYIGELYDLDFMHTAAPCMLWSLGESAVIENLRTGESVSTHCALVPVDAKVRIRMGGALAACCFLDPYGQDFGSLQQEMTSSTVAVNHSRLPEQLEALRCLYSQVPDSGAAKAMLEQDILGFVDQAQTPVDARIAQVVDRIRQHPFENETNQQLAERVGLSESQLQRLFKQALGLPIRRYRLWHRLFVTAGLMAQGHSLTESAHTAGFTDSPHFSRTFRSMLGMTPSFVFQRHSRIFINGDPL